MTKHETDEVIKMTKQMLYLRFVFDYCKAAEDYTFNQLTYIFGKLVLWSKSIFFLKTADTFFSL